MIPGGKFYGGFYDGSGDTDVRADFILALLARLGKLPSANAHLAEQSKVEAAYSTKVVDVAAGVGDLAFRLAEANLQVIAFEPDNELYAVLFDRYSKRRDLRWRISPLPMHITDRVIEMGADLVVVSNTWSHVNVSDRRCLLQSVHAALAPGGLLVINAVQQTPLRPTQALSQIGKRVYGPMAIEHWASSSGVGTDGNHDIGFEFRVHYAGQLVHIERGTLTMTMDSPAALERLLQQAGLEQQELRGSFAPVQYSEQLPGFVVVAKKT